MDDKRIKGYPWRGEESCTMASVPRQFLDDERLLGARHLVHRLQASLGHEPTRVPPLEPEPDNEAQFAWYAYRRQVCYEVKLSSNLTMFEEMECVWQTLASTLLYTLVNSAGYELD
ncbi:hypothetical protein CIB48_g2610 [Xylaria polymorpha]|nr:hypothetical protein CIB48_g2610 [Xylaria polymorpha]